MLKLRLWRLFELSIALLILAELFCSEFGQLPLNFDEIDMQAVASRLMPTSQEPYRAPLRSVVHRKPIGFFKYPDRIDLGEFNIGVYMRETLECGHALNITPHDSEPLIARRRRCRECLDAAAVLPPKKPSRSESGRKREAA